MTIHRFFLESGIPESGIGELADGQARQVSRVLRGRPGDEIVVFDGSGAEGRARLLDVGRDQVDFEIIDIDRPDREPSIDLTVGLAMIKKDRFELACQKLTEVGVREIVPLISARTTVQKVSDDAWERQASRLRRIIIEAAEQSERVTIPRLEAPVNVERFFQEQTGLLLAERHDAQPLVNVPLTSKMNLAIGPEGGWEPPEVDQAIEAGWSLCGLGSLILRAETAAIVSSAVFIQRWQAGHQTA